MDDRNDEAPRRFSEAEAKEIIARAIDLEQLRHNGLTLDQLSEAASQVGVSRHSLELAAAELTDRASPAGEISFPWRAVLAGAAIGILMTGNSAFPISAGSYTAWYPRTTLLLASVITAGLSVGPHSFRRFHVRNTGLWVGFAASQILVVAAATGTAWLPSIIGATASVSITGWITGSVLGSGLVWLFQRARQTQDPPQQSNRSGSSGAPPWHTRRRRSVRNLLIHIAQKLEFSWWTLSHLDAAARGTRRP